jgi:hypothetical protein
MGNCISENKHTNHKKIITRLSELNLQTLKPKNYENIPDSSPVSSNPILSSTSSEIFQVIVNYFNKDITLINIAPMCKVFASSELSSVDSMLEFIEYENCYQNLFHPKSSFFNTQLILNKIKKTHCFPLKNIFQFERDHLGKYVQMGTYTILDQQRIHFEETDDKSFSIFHVKIPEKNSKRRYKWVFILKLVLMDNDIVYAITINFDNSPWNTNEICMKMINDVKENEKINLRLKHRKRQKLISEISQLEFFDDMFCFDIYSKSGDWRRGQIVYLPKSKVKIINRSWKRRK